VPEGFTIKAGQGTPTISVTVDRPDRKGTISVTADNASCSSVAATLAPDTNAAAADLTFPQAFTPNGDDKNETWQVVNLLKFPDNDLQIINRWGNEVYRTKSYQNNWRATGLADGTYFYILRVALCDGSNKVYRGYITVMR
jgi:gliding motility-associated-like protein